jgi:diadenosine tetraphosphate (Ap4A) HIT family hydrolase
MTIVYETHNFVVESHEKPEVDRLEGGHIKISPKIEVEDRTKLTARQAIELMRLTIGVEIGRINYQDNGNWKPSLHIHLYGRSKNATMQKFGDPIVPGHKEEYKPLTNTDIEMLKIKIEEIFKDDQYSDKTWGLI